MSSPLWKDSKIWAGLNRPGLAMEEADLAIFGIPYDGSVSFRSGAGQAPDALRNITYTISPTTEDFTSFAGLALTDMGNIEGESREEIFSRARSLACDLVKNQTFFIMIGGDHSVTIPVLQGIDRALDQPFGIIHIDAHFDLCDHQGGDRLSHGSTERRALELDNVRGIEDIFFLGIRSIESDELDFFNTRPVQVVSAKEIARQGTARALDRLKKQLGHLEKIYLTIDIDCLDPAYAPGTGTPQFGGLTARQLLDLLEGIFDLPVIGMDIVEVAPGLDDSLVSVFAARKLVTEVCGFIHQNKSPQPDIKTS
ncbi:MAG: agmatinase [Desulfobacterales bacterium]|nr:agmatinase [Desulfobacterales bacterium]